MEQGAIINLRKGKTKHILETSIDAALLAVEIYNKPRTVFRSQSYITLMTIAWTYLFHAYFNRTIGYKYHYKNNRGRFELVDGERKSWDLRTCARKYGRLSEPVEANLDFFIKLRNKIEHRSVDKYEIDRLLFGECQALLYNYENLLMKLFGDSYAINENLVHSLQFSRTLTPEQKKASKRAISAEMKDIKGYIDNYRILLKKEVFDSQEYSIKLIQIPKISNTNRNDLAIEFVKWNELDPDDKDKYDKLITLIKDKITTREGVNTGKLKAGDVISRVKQELQIKFSSNDHAYFYKIFRVRPPNLSGKDPFETCWQPAKWDTF